ncbi:polysaccharide deacetylase family protein [Allostreptomyces psammosilenae]|uniref:Peptidoglycan/xylan/chitin deacetylase (PgdA/CDA1 family) n=1 Tax=Allostreptomyces psammosilenae TaxID=1892865 RepID=A0A852ZX04_9ACTN|nr:polysaccharide deacetylase family protein [Allostreptomyces psammosilenae]NYI06227.1 peptidoglycan/xylan/chitin deacetylase (PgdA/CDA1 family) [Allostreptomyces psammosilenae]
MRNHDHVGRRRLVLGGLGCLGILAAHEVLRPWGVPLSEIMLPGPIRPEPEPLPPTLTTACQADLDEAEAVALVGRATIVNRSPRGSSTPIPPHEPIFTMPAVAITGQTRVAALTFDDGPDARYTPAVLQTLRRYGVRATFCVVGTNAACNPGLLQAIAADGHDLANHTWSHQELPRLSEREIREELERTNEVIDRITGWGVPQWCRAPYGSWDEVSLGVCAELGMKPLGWSVDTLDWQRPGSAEITDTMLRGTEPGAIILCHDGGGDRSQSVDALRAYLPESLAAGYRFTTP